MNLVFMLEERSMQEFLKGLLPRILPAHISFRLIPHEGKTDLEKSLKIKLRNWRVPNTRFVIVRDQDSGDCRVIKRKLRDICISEGKPDALVRIVCRELEAWFIADLNAVGQAFGMPALAKQQSKAMFRSPDRLGSPSRELSRLVPEYGKVSGGRKLGPLLDICNKRSASFAVFVSGVKRLIHPVASG